MEENDLNKIVMEWSRHYDTIQWAVTGISISATGALFYCCLYRTSADPTALGLTSAQAARPYPYYIYLFGMLLPILGFIYASSYRRLRHNAHEMLNPRGSFDPILRSDPGFRTWPILFIVHLILFVGWSYLTYKDHAAHRDLLALFSPAGIVTLTLYYCHTDAPQAQLPKPRKIDLVHIERGNLLLWFILVGLACFFIGIFYCRLSPES